MAQDGADDLAPVAPVPPAEGGAEAEREHPLEAVRRVLAEPRSLSLEDVAAHAGLSVDHLAQLFEASNRLERDGYGDSDLAYARTLAGLVQQYPLETLVRANRVRARAVSQIVTADLAIAGAEVIRPMLEAGVDYHDLTPMLEQAARTIVPAVTSLLGLDYREMMERILESEVVQGASVDGGEKVDVSVGFVDLVGFTKLSASVDPQGLRDVLAGFEDLVSQQVTRARDVLLVKFIGDAAMLLSGDADLLADTLLSIIEAEPDGLDGVGRRAGIASGEVVAREGDYFGPTVNLAARLTDMARPASLVIDGETEGRIGDLWNLSRLPSTKIKGVGSSRPFRVRRIESED